MPEIDGVAVETISRADLPSPFGERQFFRLGSCKAIELADSAATIAARFCRRVRPLLLLDAFAREGKIA